MKRISLWIALLALTPTITQARWHHSLRYSVRYSPYARDYHHSGLIPGGLTYSPYVLGRGSSPLVYEGTRYTPYARTYDNPGLVLDYYLWPVTRHVPVPVCVRQVRPSRPRGAAPAVQRARAQGGAATPASRAYAQSGSRGSVRPVRERDGLQIIRQHLRDRGIGNAGISHILRIDGQLVSVSFTVGDRNLIVKYWNPEAIESLPGTTSYKQKAFERYRTNWQKLAAAHESHGGQIYTIETADEEQIVAALESCDSLDAGADALTHHTALYAKN
ncbi:MAG: hypothetical protein JW741_03755 [Sedimentisphaerales bacterium]|nr:hypothetical protein [Sedimentisphaerales bacterium]